MLLSSPPASLNRGSGGYIKVETVSRVLRPRDRPRTKIQAFPAQDGGGHRRLMVCRGSSHLVVSFGLQIVLSGEQEQKLRIREVL